MFDSYIYFVYLSNKGHVKVSQAIKVEETLL